MNDDQAWHLGLQALGCRPNEQQGRQLKAYLELLQRWNKVYNLTAVRDLKDMLPLHIFDSLSILPHMPVKRCLDVGSGGGLPGIPMAIMKPECHVTMLDTNGKKTRFIQQAIISLQLDNAEVVQARIGEWDAEQAYDGIVSRAFSSLSAFVEASADKLEKNGCFYAMKGQMPQQEIDELAEQYQIDGIIALNVPSLSAQRHLLKIRKNN